MRPAGTGGARDDKDSASGSEPAQILPAPRAAVNAGFAETAPRLRAAGYAPVPIGPGTKAPVVDGWPRFADAPPTDAEFARWLRAYRDHGVGIVCGRVVGIDLDDDDPGRAAALFECAVAVFGPTRLVRTGRPNRRMLVFRADGKIENKKRRDLAVEILSDGCQFVAYAIHPDTGKPYAWPLDDLAAVPFDQLPPITQAQVEDFIKRVERSVMPRPGVASGDRAHGGTATLEWTRDKNGRVVDGREAFLTSCTYRAFVRCLEDGSITVEAVGRTTWAMFTAEADLERPKGQGRGYWTERDAFAKARGIVRKFERGLLRKPTQQRLIPGAPPDPAPEPVPLDEAEQQLDASVANFIHRAIAGEPVHKLIVATPGLGKTEAVIRALRVLAADTLAPLPWFLTQSVRLAEQLAERYGPGAVVIRGRTHGLENPDGRPPLCARASVVERAQRSGVRNIASAFCRGTDRDGAEHVCPHFKGCGWWAQFPPSGAEVIFLAHEYLTASMSKDLLPRPGIVIIDENPTRALIAKAKRFTPEAARASAGAYAAVVDVVLEALATGHDPREALRALKPAHAADEDGPHPWTQSGLRKIAEDIEAAEPTRLRPDMPDETVLRLLRGRRPTFAAQMLRRIAAEWTQPRPLRGVYLDAVAKVTTDEGERVTTPMIYLQHRRALRIADATPVLVLDGTAEGDLMRAIWPDIEVDIIEAPRNAHVVQIIGKSMSKTSLESEEGEKLAAEVGDFLLTLPAPGVLISNMLWVGTVPRPKGWSVEHFAALRGLDDHAKAASVVVVGRPLPTAEKVERDTRALFFDRDVPLELGRGYEERPVGFRGQEVGAMVRRHPDRLVDLMRAAICEREVEQAVDRLRAVRGPQRLVVLIGEQPTRLPVDQVVEYRRAVRDKRLRAMARLGGVVPLAPEKLAEWFPDLWATAKAAEHAVNTPDSLTVLIGEWGYSAGSNTNRGVGVFGPQRFLFKRQGQPGRPSRALSIRTAEETRTALENRFGPLASFAEDPGA